jgi:cytochrome P450
MLQISGMDPEAIDEPNRVDFERDLSPHLVFGSGAHRCLGSHLARVEIRVFLEEWIARVAKFRVAGGATVKINGGTVWQPAALPLEWDMRE